MQWWRWVLTMECIFMCISSQSIHQKRRCVFQVTETTEQNYRQNYRYTAAGNVSGSVQFCENSHCCVGYYLIINGTPKVDILACDRFEKSCPDAICKAPLRSNNQYFSCVCNTDLCNGNITWETEQSPHTYSYSTVMIMKSAVKLLVGILLLICFLIIAAKWRKKKKICVVNVQPWISAYEQMDCNYLFNHSLDCIACMNFIKKNLQGDHNYCAPPSCSCQMTKTSEIDFAQLELQQIVGKGHFATVFQGKYKGSVVAVKIIPAAYEHIFTAEKEVYELPLLKHAGITKFLGAGRKPNDRNWFIVMQFAEYGSLHSFLCNHTTSWMLSLKLCQSLSQGLSYLHSDLLSHEVHKPPVAHRDLSSCNVLVRADGTCALCDFGCSTILRFCLGRSYWQNQSTNIKGNVQMGTLRYMAPEILEGFVNLSSSMFLMQGDIYALGLLLWEIWMRCSDLFEGSPVPEHLLPYELELGTNVTLENLILYVSYMDKRPSIPEHWELLPQGAALKELLTDCWDSESEARLSAHRVMERLISLQSSSSP